MHIDIDDEDVDDLDGEHNAFHGIVKKPSHLMTSVRDDLWLCQSAIP
jgi:hypothetical protein